MKTTVWLASLTFVAIGTVVSLSSLGVVAQDSATGGKVSAWSGVYSAAQNKRGEEVHAANCASCHGRRLNGAGEPDMPPSPAIARETFLRKWAGRSVSELFEYVQTKMPPDTPGRLSPQETSDSIAHMFAVSNMPAGEKELPTDPKALADIVIEVQRK